MYGDIVSLQQNMNNPLKIINSRFYKNFGAMFDLTSGNIALTDTPTQLLINNCSFI